MPLAGAISNDHALAMQSTRGCVGGSGVVALKPPEREFGRLEVVSQRATYR
jgi:hypothetical protein